MKDLPITPGTIVSTPRNPNARVVEWTHQVAGCTCNERGEHATTRHAEACAARVIERHQLELARAAERLRVEGVVAVVREIREGR